MIIEKKPGIYIIICIPTQKVYIGQSISVKSRIQEHRRSLSQLKHKNPHLQNAYTKYGVDMFVFRPLEYPEDTSVENLTIREQYWMDQFDSLNPEKGFNQKEAGIAGKPSKEVVEKLTGRKRSQEARENMSKAQLKLYESGYISPSKGRRYTEEQKRKLSDAQKNRDYSYITEEYRQNMSEKNKGKKHTDEVKQRISDSKKIDRERRLKRKEMFPEIPYWSSLKDFPTGSY